MRLTTFKGIVLRETAFGESDKIFDVFTENGIRTIRARGVRKTSSKYAAVTQLFAYAEFCVRQSKDRCYLDSATPISLFYNIRSNLESLALASYFSELLQYSATNQPQPELLRLLLYCLHYLSNGTRPILQIKAIFELRLVTELGHEPNLLCCSHCGEFLPPALTLRVSNGDFLCKHCTMHVQTGDIPVQAAALQAARHILFSPFEKLFLFRLDDANLSDLAAYTELSVQHALEITCRSLQFFHSLVRDPNSTPQ